ncbi:hypothetical protein GCG54_00013351 [Colletotrichum gloeosporioides]|uniref:Heterokaryon incompatibility domain-containing protein n=1 Tax=Colletotrichum gloeosporioides TaxID=474922 RepID=A0A8H4CGD0_COLGL|nr:uncharacterized protein GCG54_00013351 [Colletotrichum gloeosporioides]KAF3803244.1 hypothetical protein GCG54_00013351 [Colletotrichum gloeosporioides]
MNYEALSYTWGVEILSEILIVNDSTYIEITPNLASFLRHRRETEDEVILWVDAVCINQQDITERNIQVPIMNLIYYKCNAVNVWLGEESDDSDFAIGELAALGSSPPYTSMPRLTQKMCDAMESLFRRAWWNRVWIVQEICWGGGGTGKMTSSNSVTLRCGSRLIPWNQLVVACARIKIDVSLRRQSIVGSDKVLHLDYVRWSSSRLRLKSREDRGHERDVLRWVVEYRHFNATDPRDKIFAILGLTMRPTDKILQGFVVDYKETVENIYTDFAVKMIKRLPGLEILRQCIGGANDEETRKGFDLPSWVPDWSCQRYDVPLPKRNAEGHDSIPWWAVPPLTSEKDGVVKMMFPMTYEEVEKQVQEVLEGRKVFNDPQQWIKYYPREMVDELQSMVNTGKLLFAGIHDEHYIDPNADLNMHQMIEHAAKANEKLAQYSFVRNWLDEDRSKRPAYAAGIGPKSTLVVDEDKRLVHVEGIVWDEIDILHAPFPEDLDSNWEKSTEFIVAAGQCKQMALESRRVSSPYPSKEAEHAAFWDTLVVGQEVESISNFESCLPKVPKTWITTQAPLTFRNPKQAEQAERQDLLNTRTKELKDILGGPVVLDDLPPLVSSDEELQELKTSFQKLANLWSLQPYDLYHRPFSLPSVVPDPFWESRCQFDEKALEESARSRRYKWENGLHTPNRKQSDRLQKLAFEVYGEMPSIIPQLQNEEADFRLEKYALGRRFFITKKGYMGLAPIGAQIGDNVVVLFGSHVPFILRGRETGHYEVVGETYVSGIMKGEVLKDFDEGNCVAKGCVLA